MAVLEALCLSFVASAAWLQTARWERATDAELAVKASTPLQGRPHRSRESLKSSSLYCLEDIDFKSIPTF